MLTNNQLERFKNLFHEKILPTSKKNQKEIIEKGKEAREYLNKNNFKNNIDNK